MSSFDLEEKTKNITGTKSLLLQLLIEEDVLLHTIGAIVVDVVKSEQWRANSNVIGWNSMFQ